MSEIKELYKRIVNSLGSGEYVVDYNGERADIVTNDNERNVIDTIYLDDLIANYYEDMLLRK